MNEYHANARAAVRSLLLLAIVGLAACGKPAGSPCSIQGDGFTARHDCASQCLSRWTVSCPDGRNVTPGVCAGREHCTPGSCPDGQACYSFDDPFEDRRYCIPDDVCGTPMSAEARLLWEQDAAAKAAASRDAMAARHAQRKDVAPTEAQ